MHIKDHSAAMKFFRTYDSAASKGKWKEFVDEMEFDSMTQEPRTMAKAGGLMEEYYGKDKLDWMENHKDQMSFEEYLRWKRSGSFAHGGMIGKPGGLVEPGVKYYGKKVPHGSSKDKTALSADVIKKIKNKIKLPVGVKWDFYDPNPNSKTYNPNGQTYGIRKTKYPKLWDKGRNIGKEGRAEKKLIQATDHYKKIKADPDLLAEKQLYDREIYMGKREQVLEDLNFKYATDKKFREAKLEYDKIQRIENPEKYKQKTSDFYAKHGKFPPGNNYKENVWHDMFRSSQKSGQKRFLLVDESGKLLTPDNFPKVDGKVRWGVDGAYKNAKFYDTITEQFVKFDDTIKGKGMGFEKYLDQKSVGGKGAFNNAVDGYKIKDDYKNLTFKNAKGEKIRFGTLMQSKLKTKTDFIKSGINIQHPDLNNAFWKNEVSTASSNMGLNKLEQNLNRNLKAYKNNPIKKAEALAKFKINVEKLPGGITKVIEDTTYGIKPTERSVLKAAGTEFGATRYKSFNQLLKTYQNAGIGPNCKIGVKKAEGGRISFAAGGYDDCMKNAIDEHNKNLKSEDLTVRNAARSKQFNINKSKNMKNILNLGGKGISKAVRLGKSLGAEWEPIFEGAFYEWGRRNGYTHEQAKEETFFYKMLDPTTQTGIWEGAEPLLEKELYEIKGENEFIDVDNRPPMQDPEFGQVIGERGTVKRYVDNEKALMAAQQKYNDLYRAHQVATEGERGYGIDPEKAEASAKAMEATWEEMNMLEDKLDLDRDSYQAAVEKQQHTQGTRALEYGEYGQGDTEKLVKQREKRRQREMEEKFPTLSKYEINKKLEDVGLYTDPNLSYKKQTVQRPEGLKKLTGWTTEQVGDYFKDLDKSAYFAENFKMEKAEGGIASLKKK